MTSDWTQIHSDLQISLSREALSRARHLIGGQAEELATQMDQGAMPSLDGPDALRLLATLLTQDTGQPGSHA